MKKLLIALGLLSLLVGCAPRPIATISGKIEANDVPGVAIEAMVPGGEQIVASAATESHNL